MADSARQTGGACERNVVTGAMNAYKSGTCYLSAQALILTCSSCNARFLVDPAAIGADGRDVRCGRCGHEWFAAPPPPPEDDAPVPPAPIVDPVVRPLPAGSNLPALPPRRRSIGGAIGWVLLVLVIASMVGLVVFRAKVMEAQPRMRAIYAGLGFPTPQPGEGLRLADLSSSRVSQDGVQVLVIEGFVENIATSARLVPPLKGALRDSADRELQSWVFTVASPRLLPGERVAFRTEVRQPSTAATDLSITFLPN